MKRNEGDERLSQPSGDDREDKRGRLLLIATGIAVMVSAALFVWQVLERRPAGLHDIDADAAVGATGSSGGTVADFLRDRLAVATPTPEPSETPLSSTTPTARVRAKPAAAAPVSEPSIDLAPAEAPKTEPQSRFSGPDKSAVRRATIRALRRGETQMWKHDGQRGYVLVSASADYGDRTCRQVSYTLIRDSGAQSSSDPVQWCQIKRGEWGEDPYTGR